MAREPSFRRHAIQSMTGTSGRQRARTEIIERFPVAVPNDDAVWSAFGAIIDPAFQMIYANTLESDTLAQTRDLLLPKLLSGEIRVKDAEKLVDEGVAMPIPPELLIFARELRKKQTDAENLLWQVLRGRRFCGFKFRRQCPMHGYILDFYCHKAVLAVELDGGGHNEEEQRLYDEEKTKILEAAGVHVVRFWNNDVLSNTEIVLEKLYAYFEERSARR